MPEPTVIGQREKSIIVYRLGLAIEVQNRALEQCLSQLRSGALELSVAGAVRERQKILNDFESLRRRLIVGSSSRSKSGGYVT
jgi:hypothetical protein